ncbi:hypothetical protein RCC89_16985 [Cytophagaceae bacterium ABcell3]|nr:hypothetical protein RCC89_16985 [Cytophagaceae bacterium ABcell3]
MIDYKTTHRVPFIFFVFFLMGLAAYAVILVFHPVMYDRISLEDSFVENLTALSLFGCGLLLLFGGAKSSKSQVRKIALIVMGVVFLWAAGEEISWGQRIFDWETAESWKEINDQDETNIHNINKSFFDRLVDRGTIAFVFVTAVLLSFGYRDFFGIPVPSYFIILAFAITPFYHQYRTSGFDYFYLTYIPLGILLLRSVLVKELKLAMSTVITLVVVFLIGVLHTTFSENFPSHNNSAHEIREFLFSLCCLAYGWEIYSYKADKDHCYINEKAGPMWNTVGN